MDVDLSVWVWSGHMQAVNVCVFVCVCVCVVLSYAGRVVLSIWTQCSARLVVWCCSRTLALLSTSWTRPSSWWPTTCLRSLRRWRCSWQSTTGNKLLTVHTGRNSRRYFQFLFNWLVLLQGHVANPRPVATIKTGRIRMRLWLTGLDCGGRSWICNAPQVWPDIPKDNMVLSYIIWAMAIVWRTRTKFIRTVLCCAVLCTTVVHSDMHTHMCSS